MNNELFLISLISLQLRRPYQNLEKDLDSSRHIGSINSKLKDLLSPTPVADKEKNFSFELKINEFYTTLSPSDQEVSDKH